MPLKDAENEARGIWRKQKRGELCLDSNQPEGTHQDGEGKEYQPLRTGGENWSWFDNDFSTRETTAGGILRELIDEVDEQSAYYSSQLKKLSDRRCHLEQLYQELQSQIGEGGDGESEEEMTQS